jgi:CBS domain-containing membrane protein
MTDTPHSDQNSTILPKFKLFSPILAGATLRERLLGCLGALIGICVTGLFCSYLFGSHVALPLIVAPIGASAVLLFAVPASPLAQPWPIIAGNTISALVGVTVARFVHDPMLGVGLAVALAIAAMSFTRSLHPPGGAAALTAVIGGPAVASAGFWFPFVPVAINSAILVGLGLVFHRLARRNYPHRTVPVAANGHNTADAPPLLRVGFSDEDIDSAIADLNETLDIDRGDLDRLLRQVEMKALIRKHGELTCGDIMSRDVISIETDQSGTTARALLLKHDVRTLPVIGFDGKLIGTVGLRELALALDQDMMPMSAAITARAGAPAIGLLPSLTDGRTHAIVITNEAGEVEGIVSQTDLLAALSKSLAAPVRGEEFMQGAQGI